MARGRTARKRRSARRAAQRQQTAASTPLQDSGELISTLERRAETRTFAASGSASLPLGPRDAKWDAAAADKAVRAWAGAEEKPNAKYASAFFYKVSGGGDKFGDYKLGFAEPEAGKLTANWGGVTAVAGALQGARGGVQIPDGDKATIRGKVETYYAKARKAYDDPDIKTPWSADKAAGETEAYLLAYAQLGPLADEALIAMAARLWEDALAANTAVCANCNHPAGMHADTDAGDDTGACSADGCDYNAYEAESTSAVAEEEFQPSENVELALRVLADAGPDAAEYVRVRLSEFQVSLAPGEDVAAGTLPEQHQPGSRVPRRRPTPRTPAAPAAVEAGPMQWSAILAPEAKLTSDGRAFAPGAITWRELPLTLMAMIETSEGGHIGAEVAGRIDEIWRDDQAGLIRAKGVFDDGDYGEKIAGLVDDKTLRGVSVDLAIARYETGPKSDWFDEDGNWAPQERAADETPSLLDLYSEDTIAVVLEAEIGMTTVCPFPAFAEAQIAVGDSLVAGANPAFWTVTQQAGWTLVRQPEALTASAGQAIPVEVAGEHDDDGLTAAAAGLVPDRPPADWFTDPGLDGPTAITVTDDGRIYGHAATWDVCHIGLPGSCRTAPHSWTGYAYFHLGEVVCDGGERVACGQITMDTGHADKELGRADATAHYDHTGLVGAHVCCGEDEHGIWVAGALQPDAPEAKVRLLRGAKVSGDWRKVDGNLELVALLAVNVPGFPVPRARSLAASADGGEPEVISLVAAGIPVFEAELSPEERERFAALAAHAAFAALAEEAS